MTPKPPCWAPCSSSAAIAGTLRRDRRAIIKAEKHTPKKRGIHQQICMGQLVLLGFSCWKLRTFPHLPWQNKDLIWKSRVLGPENFSDFLGRATLRFIVMASKLSQKEPSKENGFNPFFPQSGIGAIECTSNARSILLLCSFPERLPAQQVHGRVGKLLSEDWNKLQYTAGWHFLMDFYCIEVYPNDPVSAVWNHGLVRVTRLDSSPQACWFPCCACRGKLIWNVECRFTAAEPKRMFSWDPNAGSTMLSFLLGHWLWSLSYLFASLTLFPENDRASGTRSWFELILGHTATEVLVWVRHGSHHSSLFWNTLCSMSRVGSKVPTFNSRLFTVCLIWRASAGEQPWEFACAKEKPDSATAGAENVLVVSEPLCWAMNSSKSWRAFVRSIFLCWLTGHMSLETLSF